MWQLTTNYNHWDSLRNEFDWVRDMDHVPQDPKFHAEGNVAIHTQMVLHELQKLPEFITLNSQEKEIILAAALFHDIEKRSTTIIENGIIRSPKHAKKGAQTTRVWLYKNSICPFIIREQIVMLVRFHGFPLWYTERDDIKKEIIKLSLSVNTKLLYILAKADILGRICTDKLALIDRIELFKEYCLDYKCFGTPKTFINDAAQFHYLRNTGGYEDYIPYQSFKSNVYLMVALPGSGKDFYINTHLNNLKVISLDDLRRAQNITHRNKKGNGQIIQSAKKTAKEYLAKGTDFVWNATNISEDLRKQLISLFLDYNAKVHLIYIEVPYSTLLFQNKNRAHPIPEKAIEKMLFNWSIPKLYEAHNIAFITK